jgi:hypothetical protein
MRRLLALPLIFVLAACLPLPTTDAPPDSPLAIIRVTGGIAFKDTTWTILPDGTVTRVEKIPAPGTTTELALPGGEAEARSLAEQLRATGVGRVASGRYGPEQHCCDRQEYEMTIALDGKLIRTVTIDGADAPAELLAARDLVLKAARAAR